MLTNEPHHPNRADMEEPLLRALIRLGGSVCFSADGRKLEVMLAQKFALSDVDRDFAAPNYHSQGNRKWRNHIQFVRDQLVKKRKRDNAVRDTWTVTDAGYRRVKVRKP